MPLVSIVCLTFNHQNFLRSALDGFLMQKTDFSFEVLVHDDASVDGTTEILASYAARYPGIIFPVIRKENLYSTGTTLYEIYTRHVFPLTRGRYIAICEGDDYWTDPAKLQKQVDFLEQNPDFTVCFHNVGILEDGSINDRQHKENTGGILDRQHRFELKELIKANFIPNCSVVYRKQEQPYPGNFDKILLPDWPLHIIHATHGNIKYLDEIMAVHRIHAGGIWNGLSTGRQNEAVWGFLTALLEYLGKDYHQLIISAFELYRADHLIFPAQDFYTAGVTYGLEQNQHLVNDYRSQLETITRSGSWKAARLLHKMVRKLFLKHD